VTKYLNVFTIITIVGNPTFNVDIIDVYVVETWYTLDGGLNNYTFTDNGTINPTAWAAVLDGPVTIP